MTLLGEQQVVDERSPLQMQREASRELNRGADRVWRSLDGRLVPERPGGLLPLGG